MKAIVSTKYGPPEVLELRDIEKPTPRDNEVLIRVYAATVNATDPINRKGEPIISRLFTGLTKPKKPIPGTEFAGQIESVGKDVTRFKVGDQVMASTGLAFGAQAEYITLPEDGALVNKPTVMSYDEAAAVSDGALGALPFLRDKAGIRKGQRVLIIGASGGVGTAAVQLAKHFGAEVTGVCSTANVALVRSLGADHVIDYTREEFTKNGQTYDIIFDAVAKSSFSRVKGSLKKCGVYLTTMPSPAIFLQMFWTSIFGSRRAMITAPGMRPAKEKIEDLRFLRELIEAGKLTTVIDRRYPLDQVAEAHKYVEKGHKKGNVIIIVA